MERSWYWRLTLVLGLVALAAYYAAPSALYFLAEPAQRRSQKELEKLIPSWLPKHRFNLGIDLQGGLHLVMGVDTEKAIQDRADRVGDEIVEAMEEKKLSLQGVRRPSDAPELEIELKNDADWSTLEEILNRRKDTWEIRSHSGTKVAYAMRSDWQAQVSDDSVAQALTTLRNRIDTYGVTEPEVRRRGANSIMIQIAGLTAEAESSIRGDIIGKTAQLEFKIVDDTNKYFADIDTKADKPEGITLGWDAYEGAGDAQIARPYLEAKKKASLREFVDKYPPPADRIVGIEEYKANAQAEPVYRAWLLERRTPLTGDALTDAYVQFDSDNNNYYVGMNFDQKGAVAFHKLTKDNTKRKMAIVLDGVVDSAPIIEGPIPNGNARVTLGGFKSQDETLADARSLSVVLKAGALPAPVYPQEERTVGASLGDDAILKGKTALLWSALLTVALMLVYYRLSGAIGALAMGINMLFLFAALSGFDATLTLPGIAGLALTVGMAVDANIVQFERIREELRLGKTARAAVDAGFDKAFSAIFDSNVTTLLAAIVLYQYGSGPVRGFATTLGIGVFINTFTAVVVPRLVLDYVTRALRVQELSI